jgi:hypothetical protein
MSIKILHSPDSQVLKFAVFDREQYKLHAFVGDKYYCYFGITNLVWNELVEAESKGLYFNTRIKNRYQFKEITAL